MSAEVIDLMGLKPQRRRLNVDLDVPVLVAFDEARIMLDPQVVAFELQLASFAVPDRRPMATAPTPLPIRAYLGWWLRIA